MSAPRIAVLAPEPIRPRMAGMGIRALELARALSAEFGARLLVPNDPAEAREVAVGIEVAPARRGSLAAAAEGAGAAVVSGHAANDWFHEVPEIPAVADLYDPFPIENLHYARILGPETALHAKLRLLPSGKPSSVALPLKFTELTGSAMVWSGPALTTGG